MKAISIFLISIFCLLTAAFIIPTSKEVVLKHHSYTSYYNPAIGEPDSVNWLLTSSMGNCLKKLPRVNVFIADPQEPETKFNIYYNGSGYDQGHQFDADDASCNQTDEAECWYFTNMVPQCPNLNRITWRALENYCRKIVATANVKITCGVIGTKGLLTGIEKRKDKNTGAITIIKHPSNISIPKYCWKRLVYNGKIEFYVMPNTDTVSKHNFAYYKTNNNSLLNTL